MFHHASMKESPIKDEEFSSDQTLNVFILVNNFKFQPSEAITAWSLFVSLLFSAIRDGYYAVLNIV